MRRPLRFALLLIVFGASAAAAQPSLNVEVGRGFDSLTPAGATSDGQAVTALSVDAEQLTLDDRLRFYYSLDGATYNTPGDWATLLHVGGAGWRHAFGAQDQHALYAGGTLAARRNGDSWGAADYSALGGFLNAEFKPSTTLAWRAGYQVDRRLFSGSPELDQTQHQVFGSTIVNLATRTTLVGEVYGGLKSYDGVPAMEYQASVPSDMTGASPAAGAGAGNGAGAGSGRPLLTPSLQVQTWQVEGVPRTTASQVTVYGRVAQGLADRTGIAVDLAVRNTFGDLPPAVVNTPARFFDDGVYDDPYASDATTASATLTHLWPSLVELKGLVSWSDRDYTSTPAYDLDGDPLPDGTLRQDEVWRGRVSLSLPVFASHTGPWKVALVAAYDYIHHRSTDAFYRYDSHAFGLGASLRY